MGFDDLIQRAQGLVDVAALIYERFAHGDDAHRAWLREKSVEVAHEIGVARETQAATLRELQQIVDYVATYQCLHPPAPEDCHYCAARKLATPPTPGATVGDPLSP